MTLAAMLDDAAARSPHAVAIHTSAVGLTASYQQVCLPCEFRQGGERAVTWTKPLPGSLNPYAVGRWHRGSES